MEKNKGGRPRLGAEIRRAPLNMKTSPELRGQIEEAARTSGLSMSQEVERRLIESFADEERLGGADTANLVRMLAANITQIESMTKGRWYEDPVCWAAVSKTLPAILRMMRPSPPPDIVGKEMERIIEEVAEPSLVAINEARVSHYRPSIRED